MKERNDRAKERHDNFWTLWAGAEGVGENHLDGGKPGKMKGGKIL